MKTILKVAAVILLFAGLACASDVAVLQNGFSITCHHREVMGDMTRLYTGSDDAGFVDVPTSSIDHFEQGPHEPVKAEAVAGRAQSIPDIVKSVGDLHHLDPDFINSVIHAESAFNPKAVSPKGAQGLMQLMPQTATELGVANAFDPGANVEGGTRYLRELLEKYNFDMIKALAAYNAGPNRVEKYHGVPPYYETQAYIARIVRDFNRKKLAERKAAAAHSRLSVKQVSSVQKNAAAATTAVSQ